MNLYPRFYAGYLCILEFTAKSHLLDSIYVLVLAGIKLVFFLVSAMVLCFGIGMEIMLTHDVLVVSEQCLH